MKLWVLQSSHIKLDEDGGGWCVNATDSVARITCLPTEMTMCCSQKC
ncbi:MAG: hypothetical protein ACKERG_01125 [Candidatus Hodgkinia cicadicola]